MVQEDTCRENPAKRQAAAPLSASAQGDMPIDRVFVGNAVNPERDAVLTLRLRGISCETVAQQLGIPYEKVLTHSRELGLAAHDRPLLFDLGREGESAWRASGVDTPARQCPVCGRELLQPARGRRKRFCSDACRYRWNDEKNLCLTEENSVEMTCMNCGRAFRVLRKMRDKRRYCCPACYYEATRKKIASMKQQTIKQEDAGVSV